MIWFVFVADILAESYEHQQQHFDRHIGLIENEISKNVTHKVSSMNATRSKTNDRVIRSEPSKARGNTQSNSSEVLWAGEGDSGDSNPIRKTLLRPKNIHLATPTPMYIVTNDMNLVNNGSCRKSCRPKDAVLTSSFSAWIDSQTQTDELLYNITVRSMSKNLVSSISFFETSQSNVGQE